MGNLLRKNLKDNWLACYDQDMYQLGEIFNWAYELGYDMPTYIKTFMESDFREAMDEWHGIWSNGPVPVVEKEFSDNFGPFKKSNICYPHLCIKWIGEAYAYLHYYTSLSSKELYSILPFEEMLARYTVGHEMSFESWARHLCT